MRWHPTDEELRLRIDAMGPEEMGRRYAALLIEHLNGMAAAKEPHLFVPKKSDDDWIESAGFEGDLLTEDEFFRMILAALDAAYPHEGALWCIGDGPMDHLVGRRGGQPFKARFHDERVRRASVQAVFEGMEAWLRSIGHWDDSWWAGA